MIDLGSEYLYTIGDEWSSLDLNLFNIAQTTEFLVSISYLVLRVYYFEVSKNIIISDNITKDAQE